MYECMQAADHSTSTWLEVYALQDAVEEMEAELYGYADKARLQVRGAEQQHVFS
jgi:hypothetical protein